MNLNVLVYLFRIWVKIFKVIIEISRFLNSKQETVKSSLRIICFICWNPAQIRVSFWLFLIYSSNNSNDLVVLDNNFFNKKGWSIFQSDNFVGGDSVEAFFILELNIASFNKDFFWNFNFSVSFCLVFGEQRNSNLSLFDSFYNHLNWI